MSENLTTLAAVAALLGLPETAKPGEFKAKISELRSGSPAVVPAPADLTPLAARLENIEKLLAPAARAEALTPLAARLDELEKNLKTAQTAAEQTERAALIAQATREGKLIPLSADTLKTTSTAMLREMISQLTPNVVPLNARGRVQEDKKRFGDLKGLSLAIAAHQADTANDEAYALRKN